MHLQTQDQSDNTDSEVDSGPDDVPASRARKKAASPSMSASATHPRGLPPPRPRVSQPTVIGIRVGVSSQSQSQDSAGNQEPDAAAIGEDDAFVDVEERAMDEDGKTGSASNQNERRERVNRTRSSMPVRDTAKGSDVEEEEWGKGRRGRPKVGAKVDETRHLRMRVQRRKHQEMDESCQQEESEGKETGKNAQSRLRNKGNDEKKKQQLSVRGVGVGRAERQQGSPDSLTVLREVADGGKGVREPNVEKKLNENAEAEGRSENGKRQSRHLELADGEEETEEESNRRVYSLRRRKPPSCDEAVESLAQGHADSAAADSTKGHADEIVAASQDSIVVDGVVVVHFDEQAPDATNRDVVKGGWRRGKPACNKGKDERRHQADNSIRDPSVRIADPDENDCNPAAAVAYTAVDSNEQRQQPDDDDDWDVGVADIIAKFQGMYIEIHEA